MVAPTDECRDLARHPEKFEAFFSSKFPGIIPDLLSAESATERFQHHQKISLKSIKCGKFGYGDSGVLLGDSSHTMTPFHAMGMITGLEDVRVFFEEFIDPAHRELNGQVDTPFCPAGVVQRYTVHRRPDVHAMTDMAAEHYHELRIGITSKANRAKKTIESSLQRYAPALDWATMYSRIQFSHERFSVIRKKEAQQQRIIRSFLPSLFVTGLLGTLILLN
jgi:kynurenine 3-monooxygenase